MANTVFGTPSRVSNSKTIRLRRRVLLAVPAVTAVAASALITNTGVAHAYPWPQAPTNLRLSGATASSLTVSVDRALYATHYRLYVSTTKSDLFYSNLTSGTHTSALRWATTSGPKMTVTGLPYPTAPYYYRVETMNDGAGRSYSSAINPAGLRPSVPTSVQVSRPSGGTSLTWNAGPGTGFTVQQATDAAMTQNRKVYTITGSTPQFSPYGLSRGGTYWFRVQTTNNGTGSGYSPAVSTTVGANQQRVSVMTYNILQATADGTTATGGTIAPWSQRRLAAAQWIKTANPDVVAIEEGWPRIGTGRQVDSLVSALHDAGANYALVETDPKDTNGNYLLYKPSLYRTVGGYGKWRISDTANVWGVYQVLQNIASGGKFLLVGTHLTVQSGLAGDQERQAETTRLVDNAKALAATDHVPVVYAGDFNSNTLVRQHPLDGPGVVMRSHLVTDARAVAQKLTNNQFDSVTDYRRAPLQYSLDIDYVWGSPGVAASDWRMTLLQKDGSIIGTIPSDHNPVTATLWYPY